MITEAISLPIEKRARVVNSLLRSLNHPESDMGVPRKRISSYQCKSGHDKPVHFILFFAQRPKPRAPARGRLG